MSTETLLEIFDPKVESLCKDFSAFCRRFIKFVPLWQATTSMFNIQTAAYVFHIEILSGILIHPQSEAPALQTIVNGVALLTDHYVIECHHHLEIERSIISKNKRIKLVVGP